MSTNELTHYGIMGMRWGIRRYQNPDGTLTEAGRKRYGISDDGTVKEKRPKGMSAVERKWAQGTDEETDRVKDYKPRSILTTKHKRLTMVKEMSDEELNERIERLQRESRYLQLEKSLDDMDPAEIRSTTAKALGAVGNKVLIPALSAAAGVAIFKMLEKVNVSDKGPMSKVKLSDASIDLIRKTVETTLLKKK